MAELVHGFSSKYKCDKSTIPTESCQEMKKALEEAAKKAKEITKNKMSIKSVYSTFEPIYQKIKKIGVSLKIYINILFFNSDRS